MRPKDRGSHASLNRPLERIAVAVTLSVLVFVIYFGFSTTTPYYSLSELHGVVALASQSGAIGFQLIGLRYLVSRGDRVFKDEFPSIPCHRGDACPHMTMKLTLHRNTHFIRFIAAFLSPFIIIEFVNFLIGNKSFLYLVSPSLSSILFDIFNYGVTFVNYFLLGTILWILFSAVSMIGEIGSAEYGLHDAVDVYCPDRIGGLSPVKKYLFSILYLFLASVALLMMGNIPLLLMLESMIRFLGAGLYLPFFNIIAGLCILILLSFLGTILTITGLNRLCSICLKSLEDRIKYINARYDDIQKRLLSIPLDELYGSEGEVGNLRSTIDTFGTERERLLQWHSRCSGVNAGTTIRLFVAYIPPLVATAFQLLQLFPR
ncbi:hypothetical protein [Methanoculleus horonobensis]|uniref:hypothetical protein n=1 Tax=Methanoculleus horonobensis TaxID=528314 RepID=UPI000A455F61|nr:hypothetical protein [Methanoculleus horonobensis]